MVLSDAVCTDAFSSYGAGFWILGGERLAWEEQTLEIITVDELR